MFKKMLITFCVVLSLSACSNKDSTQIVTKPVETVVVKEVEVRRQPPIIPKTDTLRLRDVKWTVVSKETAAEKLEDGKAYFALDAQGYENVSRNMGDVRLILQQKDAVIKAYKDHLE